MDVIAEDAACECSLDDTKNERPRGRKTGGDDENGAKMENVSEDKIDTSLQCDSKDSIQYCKTDDARQALGLRLGRPCVARSFKGERTVARLQALGYSRHGEIKAKE